MANQDSTSNAFSTVPGNFKGTLAGVVATIAVGALTHAGYLTVVSAAIGMPEATVGVLAMALIGGAANYAVTHFSGLKTYADLYTALPTTYAEYPSEGSTKGTPNNLN